MKLTYYSYHLKNQDNLYLISILDLLVAFDKYAPIKLKNSFFNHSGENIFLIKKTNNIFLIIVTKNNEIIKRINSKNLTVQDIKESLSDGESVGFVSYIFIDKDHYAIASTVQGPKNSSFVFFVEQLFKYLGFNYEFKSSPFPVNVSKDDVMTLPFVGRTTFEITPDNKAMSQISHFFGGILPDEIDSVEVTFKPRRGSDIKEYIPALNNALGDSGIVKYMLRAKENIDESLSDFYIAGNGFVSDYIDDDEKSIIVQISEKKLSNETLKIKLSELRSDGRYIHASLESNINYNNADTWVGLLHIPEDGELGAPDKATG